MNFFCKQQGKNMMNFHYSLSWLKVPEEPLEPISQNGIKFLANATAFLLMFDNKNTLLRPRSFSLRLCMLLAHSLVYHGPSGLCFHAQKVHPCPLVERYKLCLCKNTTQREYRCSERFLLTQNENDIFLE